MARQKSNKKKQRRENKKAGGKNINLNPTTWWKDKTARMMVIGAVILTFIAYIPSINNSFVNWDDPDYASANPTIVTLNGENLNRMFTEEIASNYHPLTMLTLAFDYQRTDHDEKGQLIARPFHVTNLLLHLINVVLVFWFIYLLSGKRKEGALLVALLFGLHPMHVESVAWVSERKDVLYALFFFAGLIAYMKYINSKLDKKYYIWTFVFFILACFSKPTAVLFAPVLVLIDYYLKRDYIKDGQINIPFIIEKVPFFIGALIFGYVTYAIQSKVAVGSIDQHTIPERFMFASYGVVMYVVKMIVPHDMAAFYPYPDKANLPIIFRVAPVIVAVLLGFVAWTMRKTRLVAFGVGFFLLMNILTLQFMTVGRAIMSDRYTYVPYIGLFFIGAYYFDQLFIRNEKPYNQLKKTVPAIVGIYILVLSFQTFLQCKVWENSDTLWTQVKKVSPKEATAYNNLGNYYYDTEKNTEKAMTSLNKAIELDPRMFDAYISRGKIYRQTGKLDLAMKDYSTALSIKTTDHSVYNNRGNVYFSMGQFDKAVEDYKKVIEMRPSDHKAYGNIGAVYAQQKNFPKALEYVNKGIQINPNYADAYLNQGIIYSQTNRPQEAVKSYTSFLKLNPQSPNGYLYRAQDYTKMGQNQAALNDYNKSESLNNKNMHLYKNRGMLYQQMGQMDKANADMQRYTQLGGK